MAALGISRVAAGTVAWRWKPPVTLSHVRVSAVHAVGLTAAALRVFSMTLAAVAAAGEIADSHSATGRIARAR